MDRVNELLSQHKIPIIICFIGLVLIIGGILTSNLAKFNPSPKPSPFPKGSLVNNPGEIKVDVSGAVSKPAVYVLTSESRVEDAIKAAGGFSENANKTYISKGLNLSQKVTDGYKIYIPFEGESTNVSVGQVSGVKSAQANVSEKVGVNSASASDLDKLPGIGLVTSQKIIDNRPYSSIDELLSKKVVTKSVFEKVKDLITLD